MAKAKLIYPELSYQIIGLCYDVFNEIGGGHQEKYYQKALSNAFTHHEILFHEQLKTEMTYKGKSIGRYFLDFLIDDKIVLEIKVGPKIFPSSIRQVLSYLQKYKIKLGIIVLFSRSGVMFKRVLIGKIGEN